MLLAILFWVVNKYVVWEEASDPRPQFSLKILLENLNFFVHFECSRPFSMVGLYLELYHESRYGLENLKCFDHI
jgi:hypothetical protein